MRTAFAILLSLAMLGVDAQTPVTVTLHEDILWAGIDRPGDLFVLLSGGAVVKYDKTGKKVGEHRFDHPPTLIDPLDGAQSFYYQRKGHHYGTLSYDFESVTDKVLEPAFAINPWLVCPALKELWILDSADFSIKKTTSTSSAISLETTLKHLPDKRMTDYVSLREYQNYVFLLDQSAGVHMFNPIGKFVRTFGEKGMNYFNFLGEEMYFISGGQLVFIDLYTSERRTESLPATKARFALINDDRMYLVGDRKIEIVVH